MGEFTPEQKEGLKVTVDNGDMIRSLVKHPGFELYRKALEEKIADSKNKWLSGTDEEAKQARYRAQGLMEAINELKKFILSGDQARRILVQEAQDSVLTEPRAELHS